MNGALRTGARTRCVGIKIRQSGSLCLIHPCGRTARPRIHPQFGVALKWRSIVVTNEDDVIHNIHIFGPWDDEPIDLGLQKPGATLTYRFDKPGAYRVRCNIHPSVAVTVKWPTARLLSRRIRDRCRGVWF